MRRLLIALSGAVAIGGVLAGCLPHEDKIIMDGKADGVVIQYYGDLAETLPLARQHCAQYERVPKERSHSVEKNLVIYDCVTR
jgi:hypothetical protein